MKKGNIKKIHLNVDIGIKGSLGILAYGDIGLREWRKLKEQSKNDEK